MGLSVNKIEKFFYDNGFFVSRYYTYHDHCIYFEVLHIATSEIVLIHVPFDMNFKVPESITLQKIDLQMGNEVVEKYTEMPDKMNLENRYSELPFQLDIESQRMNIEEKLEESYKTNMELKDLNKDIGVLKNIYRQLSRLKLCVQNLKFKIALSFQNYLGVIDKDNTVECFLLKNMQESRPNRQFYVVCGFEMAFDKIKTIITNITEIKTGIFHVLDKNQSKHTYNIKKLLYEVQHIDKLSSFIVAKKAEIKNNILILTSSLQKLLGREKELLVEMGNCKTTGDMHSDINYVHGKAKVQKKIDEIQETKEEIIKEILSLKGELENVYLSTDRIEFDSTVMISDVIKNMQELQNFSKK